MLCSYASVTAVKPLVGFGAPIKTVNDKISSSPIAVYFIKKMLYVIF